MCFLRASVVAVTVLAAAACSSGSASSAGSRSATSPAMSHLLTKTVVDTSGPAVRATLTLRSSTAPGFVLAALEHNDVAKWTQ